MFFHVTKQIIIRLSQFRKIGSLINRSHKRPSWTSLKPKISVLKLENQNDLYLFSRAFGLDRLSEIPQKVGIEQSIDSVTLLKINTKQNAVYLPIKWGHPLYCKLNDLDILQQVERAFSTACILSISGSKWWTQLLFWVRERSRKPAVSDSSNFKCTLDVARILRFSSGVRRCSSHRAETFPHAKFMVQNIFNSVRVIYF